MAPLLLIVAVLAAALLIYRLKTSEQTKAARLPPLVPWCVPLIGNVIGFDRNRPHITLTGWAKKYGDIFRFKVLSQSIVVINSVDLIREALIQKADDFAGRPYLFRIHYGFHYAKDIIFGSLSPKWVQMKRYAGQFLRAYTSGLDSIDSIINEELHTLIQIFKDQRAEEFDPSLILLTGVVNGITASLLGKRYQHEDPLMVEYKQTTRLFSEACSSVQGMELDLFPALRFLPNQTFQKLNQARDQIDHFVDIELDIARANLDVNNPKSILDAFLVQAKHDEKSDSPLAITLDDVRCIFVDVLVSGTLTSSIALSAFVLIISVKADLQRELQDEMSRAVGRRSIPVISDRKHMPLMEAAMLETLRYISHVPLNLPHFTMCDTTVGKHDIPKDTMVMLNLWAMHHDPRVWEDPWQFKPQRFLSSSGDLLPSDHPLRKSLLPFGAGRRMCIGETLAKERLFLFASTLLHHFNFEPPGHEHLTPDPSNYDLGLILEPKPFKIKAIPRKNDLLHLPD